MCYLAIYHPETKEWQKADGKTLDEGQLCAVVHTDSHTTEEIAPVVCQEEWDGISFYSLDTTPVPRCESCEEIWRNVYRTRGKGNQRIDA